MSSFYSSLLMKTMFVVKKSPSLLILGLLSLIFLSMWIACTGLVDFVVVRTLFAEIEDFFEAGKVGLSLFRQLNNWEIFFSFSLLLINLPFFYQRKENIIFFLCLFLVLLIFFYVFFLTPELSRLSFLWQEVEEGRLSLPGRDIQQEHQFYHQLYIALDTLKLTVLFLLGFFMIKKILREIK